MVQSKMLRNTDLDYESGYKVKKADKKSGLIMKTSIGMNEMSMGRKTDKRKTRF